MYGYDLVEHRNEKDSHTILIQKIDTLELELFPYKVSFETNQMRSISLRTSYDFTNATVLKKWIFIIDDVVSFLCDTDENTINYVKDKEYTDTLKNYWLTHIILPLYLTLNNKYYFFHAGAVMLNNKATLFTGSSYAGKSTLINYFLNKNHALLSDDKLATFKKEKRYFSHSAHPYHRAYRGKEDLGIKVDNFFDGELELGKIYWITPVKKDENVDIVELKGLKKFEVLRYATEMEIHTNKAKRFEYISNLANVIQVYNINIPRNLERLEEVYSKVIEHNKSI